MLKTLLHRRTSTRRLADGREPTSLLQLQGAFDQKPREN